MTAVAATQARRRRWRYRLDFVTSVALGQLRAEFDRYKLGWLWWILEPVSYAFTFFFLVNTFFHLEGNRLWIILISVVAWRWFVRTAEVAPHLAQQFSTYTRTGAVSAELLLTTFLVKETIIFVIALGVILTPVAIVGPGLNAHLLDVPLVMLCEALVIYWVSGLALFVGALLHDFGRIFAVFIGLLFYFSPGLYIRSDVTAIPVWAYTLLSLNPFWPILTSWQNILVRDEPPEVGGLLAWIAISSVLCLLVRELLRRQRHTLMRMLVE